MLRVDLFCPEKTISIVFKHQKKMKKTADLNCLYAKL